MEICFEKCDFSKSKDCNDFTNLLKAYMTDPMGDCIPLSTEQEQQLLELFSGHPSSYILFASIKGERVAMSTCFINISTFKSKPYTNIHDIIVLKEFRGKGVGKALMKKILQTARELGHCKVNLEVREDNDIAQRLYKELGFQDSSPPMWFWTKYI